MFQKHKERLNRQFLRYLYLISFLLGLSSAFVLYLESDYFKTAIRSENVGHFYIAACLAALILIFNWHHFIRRYGKSNVFLATLFAKIAVLIMLSVLTVNIFSAWLLALYLTLAILTWIDIDILIESCSVDRITGSIRGIYLTIMNTGYLLAPFVSGTLVSRFGFQAAFQSALVIVLIVIVVAFWKLRKIDHTSVRKVNFTGLIKKILHRPNVMKIYYVSFLLEFFYALMIIYTPLHLLNLGFSWAQIGVIFSIMLIPFVIIQYPAGYIADRKIEERYLLPLGLAITALFTFLVYQNTSLSLWSWAGILFGTRVGASLVEVLRDSYFYKRIDRRDVDIISFFRSVRPMAYLIGLTIVAPLVAFFQIKPIFIIIGLVTLSGIPVSLSLANTHLLSPKN